MRQKRVLLTGGAGFIGTHVLSALLAEGHEVRIIDALLPNVHRVRPPEPPAGVEFVHGDLRDPEVVAAALRGVDVVCHQAALVGRGREILEAPGYAGCNDLATAVLLAAMAEAGLRHIVHGSSVVIYGENRYSCPKDGTVAPGPRRVADLDAGRFDPACPDCGEEIALIPSTEDTRPDPRNVYGVTKYAQELLVAVWAREVGGTAIALRYHNVYGPGMPLDSAYSGVASTFRSAVEKGQAPRVYEDGGPTRDFVHVRDVAAANVAALGQSSPGMRAYNVASGEPRPIRALAEALSAAAGAPAPVMTGQYRLGDARHIVATPDRLRRELGWAPRVDFETGVKEFATQSMRG
ncbi:NAD-dependent epimerase/dehydratase family protein [Sphaerisporangium sp. TRM90804]|uniref:NAD-dependent epimerase/dehydratase family protein n=1 Tax=Sphaerisporangium sp. TRM90804 TaxID=3031113 RepID=UPI002446FE09|nr:NAD-dependent epimerase/dehydratase family protein [Sphaerisporangium sp. TRM90804]MDH2427226.1 NAD-dependent epimerase/dehydratase family protein [Sphaerisporangium sp. TRM90804]